MKNMFGEPVPTDVDDVQNLCDLLKSYKAALVDHQKTTGDIDSMMRDEKTPEIREKREQLKKYEAELTKTEKELGLTNDSMMKETREDQASPNKSKRSASNTSVSSMGRRSATPIHETPPVKKSRR